MSTSSKVGPPSCKNNSLHHSYFFDKCCIFVENNVYLQSLIYILLSHVLRANPSYEMAVRAHLHHWSLISDRHFIRGICSKDMTEKNIYQTLQVYIKIGRAHL